MIKSKPKPPPQVYLVKPRKQPDGSVFAIFAYLEDAIFFRERLGVRKYEIKARTLWYGQPDVKGHNL